MKNITNSTLRARPRMAIVVANIAGHSLSPSLSVSVFELPMPHHAYICQHYLSLSGCDHKHVKLMVETRNLNIS